MQATDALVLEGAPPGAVLPPTFSASKIETFLSCQRKWAWQYIAKEPRVQHASAALGSRTHTQLEHWLRDGRPLQYAKEDGTPDESAHIAQPGIEYLPAPRTPGIEIEDKFLFSSPRTGYLYTGFIDWRLPLWTPPKTNWEPLPTVGDHKTTSGLKWAKSAKDLETDVQANLYAYHTMAHYKAPRVRLQWTYLQTKGPRRALPVFKELDSPHVVAMFGAIEEVASDIATTLIRVTHRSQILELPPTIATCEAYGGCPFQGQCNLSPRERLKAVMNQGLAPSTNPLLERLKNRAAAPAPDLSKRGTPAPLEGAPAVDPADSLARKVHAAPEVVQTLFGPAIQEPQNEALPSNVDPLVALAPTVVQPGQINPPEYQPPITVVDRNAGILPPAKRGPGRPKKTDTVPAAAPVYLEKTGADGETIRTKVEAQPPAGTVSVRITPEGKIPVLYVDCFPLGGDVLLAANIAKAANDKIKAEKGVEDYRYIEYGAGPGALASVAEEILDGMAAIPRIVIDTATPEGCALLSRFLVRAVEVVRSSK